MTSSTQLALICTFVASILANSIPTFEGFNFGNMESFNDLNSFAANWPGVGAARGAGVGAAGPFARRDSGISQNNPLLTLAQKVSSTPQFNGDLGRNGESINKAGGVGSSGSTLARRQGGSGISQNNPVVDTTQQFLNHPFINGALGQNGQSINEAGGVAGSGKTLARRQTEHITVTETDTETIHKVEEVPERVLVEEHVHRPVLVEEHVHRPLIAEELVEPRRTGVLSEEFELERLDDHLLAEELAHSALLDEEFDAEARRHRGGHVLGEEFGLPVEHIPNQEENFFTNNINAVNNFTPNGIAITGVGPNGSGISRGALGHGFVGHDAIDSVRITNNVVN
ncbi:hypothetical protein CONCODRAFT_68394 [Conidiobolus coronatus NRRL 28638]|uniref:Uncharacterized protein n=1 Tax=Conidiobolus coronatus (strain ATCC 28846 / CBS 209.66 / NRRL 28638) TaxID=796925 RepID=A0A137PE79_CONC2|nr:hypothetical protein CONCODRAFT_68394 [Conidiobolus coronatus NRRL 28638]|eukprot:KXN73275.1 hypothetical protein CONCODRAFT_68394 [Conidiobolus coronatus NRRL 28638]